MCTTGFRLGVGMVASKLGKGFIHYSPDSPFTVVTRFPHQDHHDFYLFPFSFFPGVKWGDLFHSYYYQYITMCPTVLCGYQEGSATYPPVISLATLISYTSPPKQKKQRKNCPVNLWVFAGSFMRTVGSFDFFEIPGMAVLYLLLLFQ